MKKHLFILAILMVICSPFIKAQSNQPKLNQVELSKKLSGVWQQQTTKDTIKGFEMSLYKDAVLETMYRTINGVKELTGAISFTYDPKLDKFKGYWIHSGGQVDSYYFNFSSEKEVVWEWVEDFNSNKLLARNKFVLVDQDHMNGSHYNRNEVQYGTSEYIRTVFNELSPVVTKVTKTDLKAPGLNQLELAKKLVGVWQTEGKKDTIRGFEFEQYGNTILASDIVIIS